MSAWRSRISEALRSLRRARDEGKAAKRSRQEQREAEELERARSGADRFPPMRG